MNDINLPPRSPSPKAIAFLILAAFAAFCTAGCRKPVPMKLHYLPGFVPGSQNIYYPVKVGVPPVGGRFATGTFEVGGVYNADGTLAHRLFVKDFGELVRQAMVRGLSDAGLKPAALAARVAPDALPFGVDMILTCDVERVEVNKNFGSKMTVHGRYFTMGSRVKLKFALESREAGTLYSGEIVGRENEPPRPVGREVFFPLETEPAESLSVALSRAVGQFLVEPEVSRAFPLRTSVFSAPASTHEVSPAPEHP